jgi:hypothetical protein
LAEPINTRKLYLFETVPEPYIRRPEGQTKRALYCSSCSPARHISASPLTASALPPPSIFRPTRFSMPSLTGSCPMDLTELPPAADVSFYRVTVFVTHMIAGAVSRRGSAWGTPAAPSRWCVTGGQAATACARSQGAQACVR